MNCPIFLRGLVIDIYNVKNVKFSICINTIINPLMDYYIDDNRIALLLGGWYWCCWHWFLATRYLVNDIGVDMIPCNTTYTTITNRSLPRLSLFSHTIGLLFRGFFEKFARFTTSLNYLFKTILDIVLFKCFKGEFPTSTLQISLKLFDKNCLSHRGTCTRKLYSYVHL